MCFYEKPMCIELKVSRMSLIEEKRSVFYFLSYYVVSFRQIDGIIQYLLIGLGTFVNRIFFSLFL